MKCANRLALTALIAMIVLFTLSPLTDNDSRVLASPVQAAILCGDADGSGVLDLADVTFLVNYLYSNGPAPVPLAAGDQNCDGRINLTDCSYLISYLFDLGGSQPCCPSDISYCPREYTTDFDLETATQMASLAHWAYFEDSDFNAGNIISDCWVSVAFVESEPDFDCDMPATPWKEDTQLFIARDPWTNDLVVSFRGSVTLQDWISDGQFANPADWELDDGTVVRNAVHKGFLCAYQSIRSELRSKLTDAIGNDTANARVYFTGHSLGAALATLAALDLTSWLVNEHGYRRDNVALYVIGSPRPIKDNLLSHFRTRVPNAYSIIEKTDPVPYLLPTYTHINNFVEINSKFDSDGTLTKTRLEFINGADLVDCGPVARQVPWSYGQSGHDHRVYVTRLQKASAQSTPVPSLGVNKGYMQLRWSGDVQGPCDRVVLCEDCPDVFTSAQIALSAWDWTVGGSPHQTFITKREGLRAAYIDDYGRVLNLSNPYVAKTPSKLTIVRRPLGAVEISWKVADEGPHDYVAIYDKNPETQGPLGFIPGKRRDVLNDLDDVWKTSAIGGPYWVAYIYSETAIGGTRRILKIAGPIGGN